MAQQRPAHTTVPSLCRICLTGCPILVDVEQGRAVGVHGDRSNQVYEGYTCVKGRVQHEFLHHRDRLMTSMKRGEDGRLRPIDVDVAMDEIAGRLRVIVDEHGPRAVASYFGTMGAIANTATVPVMTSFMSALGSPMLFNASTIDKAGKRIARALHGEWMAPGQGYDQPDVALLIGVNPFVAYQGMPKANPAKWLSRQQALGMKLIVVDPRRTDVARRADLHLQVRPGFDVAVLGAMIHVIIGERLYDRAFTEAYAEGIEELAAALGAFRPDVVATMADIAVDDLVAAARMFADAGRGYAYAGTGPNMHGSTTLVEYLVLCLHTLCARWLRAGEVVRHPGVFVPVPDFRAQVRPPWPARHGAAMRVRGLTETPAGMPTAAIVDEILLEGPGQVRALISCGGNPAAAWPDQLKTVEALRSLDLLVQIDPWRSQTSELADYVIAPTMPLEVAGFNHLIDYDVVHGIGYGVEDAYAQYSPAIVDRPAGSDLIEEWQFFTGIARRLGIALDVAGTTLTPSMPEPTIDALLIGLAAGSRVPLDDVMLHPHGALFPDPVVVVAPGDPESTARFQLADRDMVDELRQSLHGMLGRLPPGDSEIDGFRLVVRRLTHVYNSSCVVSGTHMKRSYNPAFLHPDDLAMLGLEAGDLARIVSDRASIESIVEPDASLRRGLVSITHGFGNLPDAATDPELRGSSTSILITNDQVYDAYSGQPAMTDIRVTVEPIVSHQTGAT